MFSDLPNIMTCVSWTALVYDYFLTLDREVTFVWPLQWNLSLVLFYLNRYSPFIDQSLMMAFYRIRGNAEACKALSEGNTWSTVLGGTIVYTVVFLQTCAIWNKRRSIVIIASILLFIKVVSSLVLIHLHFATWEYGLKPFDGHCRISSTEPYLRYVSLTVFVTEAGTIGLTLARARHHLQESRSPWVHQLYQNGVYHSICVLLLSLVNAILPHVAFEQAGAFLRPQRVLESVLCTRLLFVIFERRPRPITASCGCRCSCRVKPGSDAIASFKTTINERSAPEVHTCECDCGVAGCSCCQIFDGMFTSIFGLDTMTWMGGRLEGSYDGDGGARMSAIPEDDEELRAEWDYDSSGTLSPGARPCMSRATSDGSYYASGSQLRSGGGSILHEERLDHDIELQTFNYPRHDSADPRPSRTTHKELLSYCP